MNRERGIYRGVYSALVDDDDFQALSPHAKLVLYTCRVCVQAGPAAIFRYYAELLRAQTGLTARQLEAALVELEQGAWISREGHVLWVRNGLRFDPYTTLANDNHKKSVENWLRGLPKVEIVLKFCDYYHLAYPSGWDTHALTNGYGIKGEGSPKSEVRSPKSETDNNPLSVAAAPVDWGSPEQLVALYNQLAPPGHPRVTRLTPARRKKALAYLRDFPERTFWVRAFSEIQFSRLLTRGSPERPSFRGDLDWLLTVGKNGAENCVKTAEGKFRDKEHS